MAQDGGREVGSNVETEGRVRSVDGQQSDDTQYVGGLEGVRNVAASRLARNVCSEEVAAGRRE